ncbi:hypothetical protein [Streptosporangium sp. H16]|uniref:hypothetical protein n=1 Tax=Streptosporangium sp. H16 TaxID=3444184 RepID=UPI003F78B0E1
MEYVRLGSTGMKVSRLCLGMMSYGDPAKWGEWVLDNAVAINNTLNVIRNVVHLDDGTSTPA